MNVKICFKIPGEDIEVQATTVKGLIDFIKSGYTASCIASIYINGRRWIL